MKGILKFATLTLISLAVLLLGSSQQAAAAAKPLNQGLRGFNAKTPGHKAPKTPFKVPLNDENAPFAGKSVLKTKNGKAGEKSFTVGKKAAFDKSAFVTPAG